MSSMLRVMKGAMQFRSSHDKLQRMPVETPNSLAQACSTWAKARVFSSLIVQKSLGQEVLVQSMKSAG